MSGRRHTIGGLALLAALAAAVPAEAARLRSFDSCPQLVRYATAQTERVGLTPPRVGRPLPAPMPMPATDAPVAAAPEGGAAKGAAPTAPGDASTTNVQEAGIDEPDVVKVAGDHLLAISNGELFAIDARADAPRIVGSLKLPEGGGHELLVRGDRALVIASGPWGGGVSGKPVPDAVAPADILPAGEPTTVLAELDVADPAAMRVLRTLTVDGNPVSARLNGATARVVTSSSPRWYALPATQDSVEGWVPSATLRGRHGRTRSAGPVVPCDDVHRPAVFAGPGMLTVLTVDLERGLPAADTDALMTDAQTVYGSADSLYVATQRWDASPTAATEIHRFDASKAGETAYRATGRVRGHLLNQFSLSEHDGVLRVATTEDRPDGSESFVTTLRAGEGGGLEQLGQVGGLGHDERIYAVRFIDDVGYVVTFRQVDPLYTIDLADPAQPRVVGELKIPGYSAYLHPVGEGLLLGVGQDASDEGRVRGTQLSLFDVSDPAQPRRLHQLALGTGASSDAEYDHHAFLWWPATKLAVLPLYEPKFQGAVGFRVDASAGIGEIGRIEHGAGWAPRRSAVVGQRLFTVSDLGVEVGALDTLAEQAWIAFPNAPAPVGPIEPMPMPMPEPVPGPRPATPAGP